MANVEQYNPKDLPSPAVGVPQQDKSGQIIGQSVGNALENIAETNYQRQQMADSIAAEAHTSDFAIKNRELQTKIQKSYYGTDTPPDKIMDDIQKQSNDLRNQYMGAMTTVGQKNAFAMKSAEVIKNQNQDAYTQSLNYQSEQIMANFHITGNNIATQNGQIWGATDTSEEQKYEAMHGLLDQGMAHLDNLSKVISPDKMMVARDQFLKNFAIAGINGAMETDPVLAKKLIDDKTFAGQLTAVESSTLKRDAVQQMEYNKKLGKINSAYDPTVANADIVNRATSTDPNVQKPTLSEIAKLKLLGDVGAPGGISEKVAEDTKALIKLPNEGSDEKLSQRVTELNSIFKSDNDMATKFNKVAKLQADALHDTVGGEMTKEALGSFNQHISTLFKDGLNTNFDQANRVKGSGFDFFGMFADKMIKGKQNQADAKNYMTGQLLKQINAQEQNGQKVTQDDINTMTKGILKDYVTQKNPQLLGAKDATNALITSEGPNMLHQVPTNIPGAQKVKTPDESLITLTAPDGQKVKVHPSKLKEAWTRGLR